MAYGTEVVVLAKMREVSIVMVLAWSTAMNTTQHTTTYTTYYNVLHLAVRCIGSKADLNEHFQNVL